MTNQLHDPLADLVREVPGHVVPKDLAGTAWTAGRRRRWRRRVVLGGAAAAVVALVGPAVTSMAGWVRPVEPAGPTGGPVVGGYPERIGWQWFLRDLPDRPGPLAGVMMRTRGQGEDPSGESWVAVSETGHRWIIPTRQSTGRNRPSLSNTGRFLGYFPHDQRPPYVIHDLVTGQERVFPTVWPHVGGEPPTSTVHMQTPAFWSPDDKHLLLFGLGHDLLLSPGGQVQHLHEPPRQVGVIGWVDDEHLAWLGSSENRQGRLTGATVTISDTDGRVSRVVPLVLPGTFPRETMGLTQWSAVLSPDGGSLAVLGGDSFAAAVYRFSLRDGKALGRPVPVENVDDWCQAGWAGTTPVVPTVPEESGGVLAVLASGRARPMVVVHPKVAASCLTLATDAAWGTPHGGLLGTSTAWWTWWWKEILLGCVALASALWALRCLGRRWARPPPGLGSWRRRPSQSGSGGSTSRELR